VGAPPFLRFLREAGDFDFPIRFTRVKSQRPRRPFGFAQGKLCLARSARQGRGTLGFESYGSVVFRLQRIVPGYTKSRYANMPNRHPAFQLVMTSAMKNVRNSDGSGGRSGFQTGEAC
jgi:hypothetical protein